MEVDDSCAALERLRSLVADLLDKHLLGSAVFFADKLVSLSDGAAEDVFLLAQAHVCSGAHTRALALLRAECLTSASPRFLHLTAACLVATAQFDEALALLGEEGTEMHVSSSDAAGDSGVATAAACELLRGRVYLALENRPAAARCFRAALRCDPLCYEAFEALLSGQMLTPSDEAALLASLSWAPGDAWVGQLYCVRSGVRSPGAEMGAQLQRLSSSVEECGLGAPAAAALLQNADVLAAGAEWSLMRGDAAACYAATSALLVRDPLRAAALPCHISAACSLGKRNELFARGHALVGADPASGLAWFAVGSYYACTGQHAAARRYLARCTALQPGFAPGWLAYGHAFAAGEEGDQALAAYRTAARLFPGAPLPLLYMGAEYARGGHWALARQFLSAAAEASPGDPAPRHELACVALRAGEPQLAQSLFEEALRRAPQPLNSSWEATLVGLGHALRKQRRLPEAAAMYRRALALLPRSPGTLTALAFTAQLGGDNQQAIDLYHAALGLRPDDAFAQEMLHAALSEEVGRHLPEC